MADKPSKRKFYPKIDRQKIVHSRFLLTVSANRKESHYDGGLDELKRRLAVCFRVLEKKDTARSFVYILDKKSTYEENVKSVSCEWAVEKGARSIWHGHALFVISHNTRVRMSFPVYKSFACKALGIKSCYFNAKLLPKDTASNLADVREYINKSQVAPAKDGEE